MQCGCLAGVGELARGPPAESMHSNPTTAVNRWVALQIGRRIGRDARAGPAGGGAAIDDASCARRRLEGIGAS